MRIKEVTIHKEIKIGLPSFSNITASAGITFEVGENEEFDWEQAWDIINQQMSIQSGSIDPSWIQTKQYKNFFKTVIKTQKGGEGDDR